MRTSAPAFSSATGRARLHDVAREPRRCGAARAERLIGARADRGIDDELVVFEQTNRARVGVHELGSLLDDFVEDRRRVELGRQQPARARQLLSERARTALGLEELAALERAAGRVREMARELEIVFREHALLVEEDDDEAARLLARRLDGHGEQRAVAVGRCGIVPASRQPLVLSQCGRGDDAPLARLPRERAVALLDSVLEHRGEPARELMPAGERQPPRVQHEHRRRRTAERFGCRLRHRVERRRARQRQSERGGDAIEAALDACLT